MTGAHATKQGVRYLYYVSAGLIRGQRAASLTRVSAPRLRPAWRSGASDETRVLAVVRRLAVARDRLVVELEPAALHEPGSDGEAPAGSLVIPVALHRPVHARRAVGATAPPQRVDRALVRAVVLARTWADQLARGEATLQAIAAREGVCPIHMGALLPLAWLAPDLVAAILDGRRRPELSLRALAAARLPLTWAGQRAALAAFF